MADLDQTGQLALADLCQRRPTVERFRLRRDRSARISEFWRKLEADLLRTCHHHLIDRQRCTCTCRACWPCRLAHPRHFSNTRRPHMACASWVAPKRREHLSLVELKSVIWRGFSNPSWIFVTDSDLPVEFTISVGLKDFSRLQRYWMSRQAFWFRMFD